MSDKTFVLGLGAQKAGTSWLHAYISSAPNADLGFTKEYHVWDARSGNSEASPIPLTAAILFHRCRLGTACFQRWPSLYFRYFHGRFRGATTLTGDITPAYACLGPEEIQEIVGRFAELNVRVKIVFVMRDPVDRCWSAARMKARRRDGTGGDASSASILRAHYRNPNYQVRTRYERVLKAIDDSGIPATDVYLGFYEEMFTPSAIERLSDFLDIPSDPAFGQRQVFSAFSRSNPPQDLAREVANFYAATYGAIAGRSPRARSLWPGFRLLSPAGVREPWHVVGRRAA